MLLAIPTWGIIAAAILSIFTYSNVLFWLVGKLVEVEKKKTFLGLLVSAFNVAILYPLSFFESGSASLSYVGIYLLLLFETWLLYRVDLRRNLFLSVTFMIHIMCFHAVFISIISMINGISIHEASNSIRTALIAIFLVAAFLSLATVLFAKIFPMDKVNFIMGNAHQRLFLTVWMSVCALYLLYSATIYQHKTDLNYLYLDQILKSVAVLSGVYIMLLYNLKVSELLGYKKKSEKLTTQLHNSLSFLDAVTGRQNKRYEINLTQNLFRKKPVEEQPLEDGWQNFEKNFPILISERVFEDDVAQLQEKLTRQNLLELYERGERALLHHYRIRSESNEPFWYRLHFILQSSESGDILAFAYATDVTEEFKEKMQLHKMAETDLMTGIYNKKTFENLVSRELKNGNGTLLIIDMDSFKEINDCLGHDVGDEILKETAKIIKDNFRTDDIVGRIGGDEFMVYAKGIIDTDIIAAKLETIVQKTRLELTSPTGKVITSSVSVGGAVASPIDNSFATTYKHADMALYKAKRCGRGQYRFFQK